MSTEKNQQNLNNQEFSVGLFLHFIGVEKLDKLLGIGIKNAVNMSDLSDFYESQKSGPFEIKQSHDKKPIFSFKVTITPLSWIDKVSRLFQTNPKLTAHSVAGSDIIISIKLPSKMNETDIILLGANAVRDAISLPHLSIKVAGDDYILFEPKNK